MYAASFGQGVFGEDVPFGSLTSLSMAINGSVDLPLVLNGNVLEATDSHTVVVTSTDVVGFKLYTHALSTTNLTHGSDTIPASANVSPAPLATNSWGYNTDASNNFVGMLLTSQEIKSVTGPAASGDTTTITYKAVVSPSATPGAYSTTIVYTAVPETQ